MDSSGNVNYSVSVVEEWIFDSTYEKAFPLNIYSLNLICGFSDKDAYFEKYASYILLSEVCKSKRNIKACTEVIQYYYAYIYIYIYIT